MAARFSRTTRALAQDHARWSLLAWAIAGALALAWGAWFVAAQVTLYEVSRKARIEVRQAAHPVSAGLAGRLAQSGLAIGQRVRAGEVIAELDAGAAQLKLREEELRLQAIAPRIASLRKEIAHREQADVRDQRAAAAASLGARYRVEESEAAIAFAREHARRLAEESQAGSVPRVDAQRAAADARKLTAQRDALSADMGRLESDALTRSSQNRAQIEALQRSVVALDGDVGTARATIERLRLEIDRHRIRAPIDGRVGEIAPLRVGTWVSEGQSLATLVPDGDFLLVADFPAAAAFGRIRPGQPAQLRLDGFPWAQYGSLSATVLRVGSEIRDQGVRVELSLQGETHRRIALQHGLPGSVEIAIEQTTPALLVLRSAGQWLAGEANAQTPDRPGVR